MATFSESSDETRGRRDLTGAGVFILLALVVFYLPQGFQGQLAAGFRATLLRPFLSTQEFLAQARLRAEDAGLLQDRLDSLAARVTTQAPLVEENRRLQGLLDLKERAPNTFLPGSVIRPGTPGSESMFLLDVGSEQGVRPGDPVIMREGRIGLVGMVQQVRGSSAIGVDWSHPDFRASASSADGSVFGMVQAWRGLFREEDRLVLDGTPYYERLEEGTTVVTSGLGGIFPRGIPIGTVESVRHEEGSWRRSYWLRPLVQTGSVTHVLVILSDGHVDELMELFREPGDDPPGSEPSGEAEAPADEAGGTV